MCLVANPTVSTRSSLVWRSTALGLMPQHARIDAKPSNLSGPGRQRSVTAWSGGKCSSVTMHAGTYTIAVSHDAYRAVTPSQLADELHHYAYAATATGNRPANDAFLATCLRELSSPHRLRRLRPRQIASVLRSLVRLGAHPGEDWLAELDAACYCHPGPFDPASATAVLQYLAALHLAAAPPQMASPPVPAAAAAPSQRRGPRGAQGAHGRRQQLFSWEPILCVPTSPASAAPPAALRFPHAVYLRLLQGGVSKYTYEQLAMLLQAFRRLGVEVDDELAMAVGCHMAVQLAGMAPGRRSAALRTVLGGSSGSGSS